MENRSRTKSDARASDLPNGPVAAALLAGGIGAAVTGLMTVLAEASSGIADALRWSEAVGPLSGKTGVGVIAFFLSWLILHFMYQGRDVNFTKFATISYILLGIGLLFTFPPFFLLFAGE